MNKEIRDGLRAAVADVVANDNCSGCGGCTLLSRALSMQFDGDGFLRPVWDETTPDLDNEDAQALHRFRSMCPGVSVRAPAATSLQYHPTFGAYTAMWSGWATDPVLRHAGSSGGVLSALADWLLASGHAPQVIGAKQSASRRTQTEAVVLTERKDVVAAAGSRYAPVATVSALEHANREATFIGKPCEAYAVRRLDDDSRVILSFLCAGVPSQHATDALIQELGVDTAAVSTLRYRGHGCPGRFTVSDSNGTEASASYEESWGGHLGRRVQARCKICPDATGEHADVAVGDYWPVDAVGYPVFEGTDGRSVVIARTVRGREIVEKAAAAGVLELEPVAADEIARVQPLQVLRREALVPRLVGKRLGGDRIPSYRGHHLMRLAMGKPLQSMRQLRGTLARTRARREAAKEATYHLTVLQSFPAPGTVINPYTVLLRDSLAELPGIEVHTFDWKRALAGRYDVLHVHWPEALIERRRLLTTTLRQLCYLLLLVRLVLCRTALVRTVHNLDPPTDLPWQQRFLLGLTDRLTTLRIAINESTPVSDAEGVVIPHGHYRSWYGGMPAASAVSGRIVFFGRIRRYKRVDVLVRAFREIDLASGSLSLRITGRPSSEALKDELRELAGGDSRITFDFNYLDDAAMVREVSEAELIVLPYPEMHNSGSALAALSLDRPVLVVDNDANRRLSAEVGPGWVYTYAGPLSASDIVQTLERHRNGVKPRERPNLDLRDWQFGATRHAEAYVRATKLAKHAGRSRRLRAR